MGAGVCLKCWLGSGIHALGFAEGKTIQNGNGIRIYAN